jgi:hypothetical protein
MIPKEVLNAEKRNIRWYGTELCCQSYILVRIYGDLEKNGKFTGNYIACGTHHINPNKNLDDLGQILFNPCGFEQAKKYAKEKVMEILKQANAQST